MITKLNKNYDLKENANYILEREKIFWIRNISHTVAKYAPRLKDLITPRSSTPFQISYMSLSLFLFWSQRMADPCFPYQSASTGDYWSH